MQIKGGREEDWAFSGRTDSSTTSKTTKDPNWKSQVYKGSIFQVREIVTYCSDWTFCTRCWYSDEPASDTHWCCRFNWRWRLAIFCFRRFTSASTAAISSTSACVYSKTKAHRKTPLELRVVNLQHTENKGWQSKSVATIFVCFALLNEVGIPFFLQSIQSV